MHALREGFERPLVVLLLSVKPMNLEVVHQKLKAHCERMWGSESSESV